MSALSLLSLTVDLPPGFRSDDILAFHRRDPLMVAERVAENTLEKGLAWEGMAACLTLRFQSGYVQAGLAIDGSAKQDNIAEFERMVRRMLGLAQRIEDFEDTYRTHPCLGRLIARNLGFRVPSTATPFEALIWAITGQQITVSAAISIRRRLILASGLRHSSGLGCHPDASLVARMSESELREVGFSQTKARTLVVLSRLVHENALPLSAWSVTLPIEEIRERLLQVNGIGPWTVNYVLLRGFGWLDGSLHGDVAVRRSLQSLLDSTEKITEEQAKNWLVEFSPWRALVAAHLWAMKADLTKSNTGQVWVA
jgi:DNA-3-methyladenine glycosylase II